jgi:hypothetical protein
MQGLLNLKKDDNGQSVVEFALILPLFLAIILGIIEFGWILNGYVSVNSAAREGARIGIVDQSKINETVINVLGSDGSNPDDHINNLVIIYNEINDTTINRRDIAVKVSVEWEPILGIYINKGDINLVAEAVMRREQ